MAFNCRILADSINSYGVRLTTFECTFPRIILAEVNTHRMLSRNYASSRAITTSKQIERLLADPWIPENPCKNQKGMTAAEPLTEEEKLSFREVWIEHLEQTIAVVESILEKENVHKQWVNRLLEPWMWTTGIISATDWSNFFALRCHPDAQPEFQKIAAMMYQEYTKSTPKLLVEGEWHLPLIDEETIREVEKRWPDNRDEQIEDLKRISVGRCCRVSYLTHDGKRDINEDIKLHNRLCQSVPKHMSPFEHVATPMPYKEFEIFPYHGNFRGWNQYRKFIIDENIIYYDPTQMDMRARI